MTRTIHFEAVRRPSAWSGYTRLLRYAWPRRYAWAGVVSLNLLGIGAALLQPWPMKVLVDHVLWDTPLGSGLATVTGFLPGAGSRRGLLALVAVAGFVLWVLQGLVEMSVGYLSARAGRSMACDLGRALFARIQRRSLLFHGRWSVGDSMTRIVTDTWCVSSLLERLLIGPVPALLTIATMVLIMQAMDPVLTLIALAAGPLMAGSSLIVGRRVRRVARARREVESRIHAHVQQTLTGIHTVQAYGQENRERDQFRGFAEAVIGAQKRTILLKNLSSLWTGLFATLGTGAVLLIGGRQVLRGSLSLGGLLVFVAYLHTLQAQMNLLARCYTGLQSLRGQIDRVLEILDGEPELPEPHRPLPLRQARGDVRIENVTFGYESDRPVLSEVSLAAAPGQIVALVGPSGAGKTTLVSLIPRFFDPWQGSVSLDGVDLRHLSLRELRRQIAIVLQEPVLFAVRVAENIACGRPDATRNEVMAAARAAGAHEFIMRLPQGYDTVVGERGCTLSGGERQRISIARALLKNAPVLILDEPTSAIDARTEELLVDALRRLMQGRTTFMIAHRLSTIRHAHQVIVLQSGRIVESGTHQQLVQRRGLYATLSRSVGGPSAVSLSRPTVAGALEE